MIDAPVTSTSPRRIRHSNAIAALQALFDRGPLSRAEIARQLGLNRSSSGHIIAELAASSLVREVEGVPSGNKRAGRPGILLDLEPEAACFVGAEIGVEHLTTLVIDLRAEITHLRVEPFDGRAVTARDAVRCAVAQAMDNIPSGIAGRIEGFGVSAPAQMDPDGKVRIAPLLGWQDEDLIAHAREALGPDMPVMIENEANAFAFGENYKDRDKKSGVTLFLVLESGVGGGIMIDGRLFRGGHGLAGEIGHVRLRDGRELEQIIGLDHLLQRYGDEVKPDEISLAAFLGDVRDRLPGAVEIAEDWARDLARAIAASCRLVDPNRIVLGGSVAALYPLVAARVAHHIGARQAQTFPMPQIVLHDAAEAGAAFGAACMLHSRFLSLENHNLTDQTHDTAQG